MGFRNRAVGLATLLAMSCGGASTGPTNHKQSAAPPQPQGQLPEAPGVVAVAPVPLRRLTREEYNHAVRDLLGDTTRPADAFPPDEALGGFESNNIAPVSALIVQRYVDAAEALAAAAAKRVNTLAPCATSKEPEACARDFIDEFGRLAYRRPLEDDERATLLSVFADKYKHSDYADGIRLVLEAILESPQFLYRVEPYDQERPSTRPLSGYEIATRLSFFIWTSTPDRELLDDAAAGKLSSPDDIRRAARRLMKDPRAADGIRSFHRQWLGLRELETVTKDAYARKFTPELKAAMLEETLRFSANAVSAGGDTVKTLLTSHASFVDAKLAALYGVRPPKGSGFAPVDLPPEERAGLLTQASVMALLTSGDQTSPVLRGKFVREKFLCDPIAPPPPSVVTTPPKVDPELTTKERFARHRNDPSCAACHVLMDPIGFGFEHYDGIGAWRTVDGKFPVDAVGELSGVDGVNLVTFDGAIELGARLAASEQVRRCIVTQWFRYALGRGDRDEDRASMAEAYGAFADAGFDVRELMVAIAASDAFRFARFEEGNPK
jgi:Protein of unknown function (DUF1592)/Protein of unknown function (DUF1588)/Protein of unknown function (DUF1595)/Protein of unknown function (DUF1587)/Protein of unknown function (DUF1585)